MGAIAANIAEFIAADGAISDVRSLPLVSRMLQSGWKAEASFQFLKGAALFSGSDIIQGKSPKQIAESASESVPFTVAELAFPDASTMLQQLGKGSAVGISTYGLTRMFGDTPQESLQKSAMAAGLSGYIPAAFNISKLGLQAAWDKVSQDKNLQPMIDSATEWMYSLKGKFNPLNILDKTSYQLHQEFLTTVQKAETFASDNASIFRKEVPYRDWETDRKSVV